MPLFAGSFKKVESEGKKFVVIIILFRPVFFMKKILFFLTALAVSVAAAGQTIPVDPKFGNV